MADSAVREILEKIDLLAEEDRLVLEQHLAAKAEAEWLREAAAARDDARRRGIDQATIDRAVDEVRYSPKRQVD